MIGYRQSKACPLPVPLATVGPCRPTQGLQVVHNRRWTWSPWYGKRNNSWRLKTETRTHPGPRPWPTLNGQALPPTCSRKIGVALGIFTQSLRTTSALWLLFQRHTWHPHGPLPLSSCSSFCPSNVKIYNTICLQQVTSPISSLSICTTRPVDLDPISTSSPGP